MLRDLTLENPIRAIREISHDTTCRGGCGWPTDGRASALDIQGEYLSGRRFRGPRGLSPQEDRALEMWEHCLKGLERDPSSLGRECDWVMKHRLIEHYRARHASPYAPQGGADRPQYHDVDREPRALLQAAAARRDGADVHRRRHHRAMTSRRRRPGPGSGASS